MIKNRASGILLHITSLPSAYGTGDFGKSAYKFVDFLKETGTGYWQVLPLNPTDNAMGNAPYSSSSAFALNPLLIDPDQLLEDKLISKADLRNIDREAGGTNYNEAYAYKDELLDKAHQNFEDHMLVSEYSLFCRDHSHWLDDYALFISLKKNFSMKVWNEWPAEIRDRKKDALDKYRQELKKQIEHVRFIQFIAYRQWTKLHKYSKAKGIQLFGDIPIYVQYDSADVWSHPKYFKLDGKKNPTHVAGVPPDYFSETGQLWGNPVYNWQNLKKNAFDWWVSRLKHNFKLFDLVRIDHFRGLVGYWEVKAGAETAIDGKWKKVPVWDFYDELQKQFPYFPVIAEDLGTITPDVTEFLLKTNIPGMRVLQFGFLSDKPDDVYLPHNFIENCVAYTGTHDNNTMPGWYRNETNEEQKDSINKYFGKNINDGNIGFEMIRLLLQSIAGLAFFQLQDLLNLDSKSRMNKPGTNENNWAFSFSWEQLTDDKRNFLKELNYIYNRN